MRTAICKLKSAAPYSQSAPVRSVRGDHEDYGEYEERIWRERLHLTEDGAVFIPPMSIYHSLVGAARFRSQQIKGHGKKTYTKRFESGVMCVEPLVLDGPVKLDKVIGERLFLPSDCTPGGGKRVWKTYPMIQSWTATAEMIIADDLITEEVFNEHLADAGRFIGLGRFRPEKRGFYGRFKVESVEIE